MNLTSEQPAAFSALVEILDFFFLFMTQAYIQFEEKNKERKAQKK